MLSADEAVLFVAMTRDNSSWRVPLMRDGGAAKVGRFSLSFGTSGPDGLTMDQNGRLFVALASLGHVFVMAPNGETIAVLRWGDLHEPRIGGGKRHIAHYGILYRISVDG